MARMFVVLTAGLAAISIGALAVCVWVLFVYGRSDLVLFGAVVLLGLAQLASFLSRGRKESGDVPLDIAAEISHLWDVISQIEERFSEMTASSDLTTGPGVSRALSEIKGQIVVLQSAVSRLSFKEDEKGGESLFSVVSPDSPEQNTLENGRGQTMPLQDFRGQDSQGHDIQRSEIRHPVVPLHKDFMGDFSPGGNAPQDRPSSQGTLSLFLEPIIDLIDGRALSYAASLRLKHSDGSYGPPLEAKNSESEFEGITRSVLALKKMREHDPEVLVFCRVSEASFARRFFVDRLVRFLRMERSLVPHFVLQITQETFLSLSEEGIEALASLAELGCVFCLSGVDLLAQDWEALSQVKVGWIEVTASVLEEIPVEVLESLRAHGMRLVGTEVLTEDDAKAVVRSASYARGSFLAPAFPVSLPLSSASFAGGAHHHQAMGA